MSLFRSKLLVMLTLMIAGCSPRSVSPPSESAKETNEASSDDVLTSALYQLNPENFGINSSMEKPVSLLNSWRMKQTGQQGVNDEPVPVKMPAGWEAETDESRLAQAKFDFTDVNQIRDALLYHTIAGYLADRAREEVLRVNVIVDFVCRNVSLWKDDEIELPLSPYLALQSGRGSADDRAWLCTEILRQLRLDTVIIRAKADVKESSDKWLMGVIIEGQVYLYDLRLGLPLKNGDGATAALAEIIEHPEWLQQMSTSEMYRLTADDLREPSVSVVANSNFWCRRMHNLEQVLPATSACVLYDPMVDEDGRPGMLQRIATNGKFPIASLKRWQYPARQRAATLHPTEESKLEMVNLFMPFNVPIPFRMEAGKPVAGTPERKLQKYRIDQLLGKFSEATKRYLSIRHLEVEQNPPELERLNRMAAQDAIYWTAICKFEMGEFEKAVEPLSEVLKKYDRKGKWYFPARVLLAQCRAELGQFPEAITILERTSSDDPYREANAIRVKRWSAARSK